MAESMAVSNRVDSEQLKRNQAMAEAFNRQLSEQAMEVNHPLGQADFFRILSAQLANQDPLKPMEDKEFIAQMAQFSSLEQMKSMSTHMASLSDLLQKRSDVTLFSGALQLLGKEVTVRGDSGLFSGKVSRVSVGADPEITIGNQTVHLSDVVQVQ